MVNEIVILPTCFNEKNISMELIQVFKDIYNYPLFISDFENSNWISQIKTVDSNEAISDSLRKALQVFLKKIKNRVIVNASSQTDFSKIINWLQEIKKYENINCVLITSDDLTLCKKQNIDFYQNIKDVILADSTQWDSVKVNGLEIKKIEAQTEKILKTIANNTDKAILVDGYYNPNKKNFRTSLHLISRHLGQSNLYKKEDKRILIHASKKMTQDVDLLKKNIEKELIFFKKTYNIRYEFYLWNYIHDRSFLTDKICLESTSGLEIIDENSPGDNTHTKWVFLPHNIAEEQLNKYDISFDDDIDDIFWKYST
ncbi:hypothetical protein PT510_04525 [Aliarcobacter butzleri]|uniref:hypothetical protein n=1 Tax=Aliarcobacter butzleri TaxID=28197 RepID=UPI0024DEFB14|nr:hypothetical protein [Aliarcobacter butzleri]MDK2069859.1 hypothetical protein [Aliarcobacter butzleri]